ncbi:MAG: SDR family oxidoreductase [Ruminococcaceae bacterium]|nr:SDR family oxidoreductase [Oscillospiraceae bacterium]
MERVLISGGSRGIGAAMVRAFTRKGHKVAFLYQSHSTAAKQVAAETGATAICCDISDPIAVKNAVSIAASVLGGAPSVLINNAGISMIGLSRDMTDEEWKTICDTNLSGAFYLCREAQSAMIAAHYGRIINIGSMWGKTGASCEVAYSATKAGLRGLTMALAKELGPAGITVNCVEPGLIETEMNQTLDKAIKNALIDETPVCRIGTPDDVAAAVLFFADPNASFITGQILGVDGGFAV